MQTLDSGSLPAECAADVHEAGVIERGTYLSTRIQHATHFVGEHRRRDLGILDSECTAEPAALLCFGEIDQVEPSYAPQEPSRLVAHVQRAQRMAGRVKSYRMRKECAHICNPQLVNQQFGKLEDARHKLFDRIVHARISGCCCHFRVVVPDHRNTRRRRHTYDFSVLENLQEMTKHWNGFPAVSRVVVHLAAARLCFPKFNGMAEPFQNTYDSLARVRK